MSLENGKVTVSKEGKVIIEIDGMKRLRPSGSGKNVLVCTGKADVEVNGRMMTVAVNVYTKPE